MTKPSAPSVALRYAAARVAAVKIPDPYNMTKAEFLNPRPPKARSGYQLLYHVTSNDAARDIARNGLLTSYSKSPPKGTIWASTKPDDFYGKGRRGALITFQVPKRGTPADQDPYNGVRWDMGENSVVIWRDIAPRDIVDIDLWDSTGMGNNRLSWLRGGSRYAEIYWDKWFGPRQKGKTAARPIRLPTREIKTLAKRLAQRLYQYGLPKPGRVIAQEYLPLTNVMGDEVVVEILLTGTPGRNHDPFSNELLNGGFLKRRPEGPVMRVFVNPHLDPRTFEMRPRRIVEDELYRLLAHELTHAADVWSGKGSVGDLSGSMDDLKKHHHNHPAEVRALMRDVVSNLDDGDTVREFMGYGMDFNTALREALKDTKWPDIEPYLTPRNKKTILKGVYTFLQDQGLDEVAR